MSFTKMSEPDLIVYLTGRALSGTVVLTSNTNDMNQKRKIVVDAVVSAQMAVDELKALGILPGGVPKPAPVLRNQSIRMVPAAPGAQMTQTIEVRPGVLMTPDGSVYRKEELHAQEKESPDGKGKEGVLQSD